MKILCHTWLILLFTIAAPALAAEEQLHFNSATDKALYDSLIVELRCLVCQNQNIADSNADLAKDLRSKTYELIQAGQTEAQIKQFMRDRYGDFVLYAPPLDKKTWLLWLGPFLILIIVLLLVGRFIKQQSRIAITDETLNEANHPISNKTTLDNETLS